MSISHQIIVFHLLACLTISYFSLTRRWSEGRMIWCYTVLITITAGLCAATL